MTAKTFSSLLTTSLAVAMTTAELSSMSVSSISGLNLTDARYTRKKAVIIKEETTYGEDAAPMDTDFYLVEDFNFSIDYQYKERAISFPTFSNVQKESAFQVVDISFTMELSTRRANGLIATAANPPGYGLFLKTSGMGKTVVSTTDVLYSLSSTPSSFTIGFYDDGIFHKAVGCVSSVKIICKSGDIAKAAITAKGFYSGLQKQSLPTISNTIYRPEMVDPKKVAFIRGGSLTNYNTTGETDGTTSIIANGFEFDMGNVLTVNPLFYIPSIVISDKKPVYSFEFSSSTAEDINFYQNAKTTTLTQGLYFKLNNSSLGFSIASKKVAFQDLSVTDMDGQRLLSVKGYPFPDGGNDEYSIYLNGA